MKPNSICWRTSARARSAAFRARSISRSSVPPIASTSHAISGAEPPHQAKLSARAESSERRRNRAPDALT
jgi:hypothetical protein